MAFLIASVASAAETRTPVEFQNWLNPAAWELAAGPNLLPTEAFVAATATHACSAGLGEGDRLPSNVSGQIFPYSLWAQEATQHRCNLVETDPAFATKIAWNASIRWDGFDAILASPFVVETHMGTKPGTIAVGQYRRLYIGHRADLPPGSRRIIYPRRTSCPTEPDWSTLHWTEVLGLSSPARLRAAALFRERHAIPETDVAASYLPETRRLRRRSGYEPDLFGLGVSIDDLFGFSGRPEAFEWTAAPTLPLWAPVEEAMECFTRKAEVLSGCTETAGSISSGMSRDFVRVDAVPKGEGTDRPRHRFWFDRETMIPVYEAVLEPSGALRRLIVRSFRRQFGASQQGNARGTRVLRARIQDLQQGRETTVFFDNAKSVAVSDADVRKRDFHYQRGYCGGR